jgi:hypothetical protein
MTVQLEILADKSAPRDQLGNLLTLEAELVPGVSLNSEPEIGISLVVNDGEPEVPSADPNGESIPATPNTELYFRMPMDQALQLAQGITELVEQNLEERTQMLMQALEFKSAQLSCAKGSVGTLEIVKVADSDRGNVVGFGFYDLNYFDDSGDDTLLHAVKNVECYVPFMEEEQYEWLRSLVGGNHQFTATIQIKLVGFNLEEIRNEFHTKLAAHYQEHHNHEH